MAENKNTDLEFEIEEVEQVIAPTMNGDIEIDDGMIDADVSPDANGAAPSRIGNCPTKRCC